MEAETVFNLYNSYWFYLNFFNRRPSNNQQFSEIPPSNSEIPTLPTIHTKSPIQTISSNFSPMKLSDYSASPNSVLESPKLQTIFSGKVSEDVEDSRSGKEIKDITTTTSLPKTDSPLMGNSGIQRRRKKKGLSKSLSDLEFEELKGFIDLGFVFSDEDKDSTLVSIIPGLQRLLGNKNHTTNSNTTSNNNNNNDNDDDDDDEQKSYVDKVNENKKLVVKSAATISRPYLSESWQVLEKKRRENNLLNWRVPTPNNQHQMKDNLRCWAHTVASTVR